MNTVVHVIATIGVLDVDIVRVAPTDRPGIDESERVATVLKTTMIVVAPVDVEAVPAAKVGGVVVVGNATVLVAAATASTGWLLLRAHQVPSRVALRCAIYRMCLLLLRARSLLHALWLSRPGSLCRFPCCGPGLPLRPLPLLCWPGLLLCRSSALRILARSPLFPCEGRSGSSEKCDQYCYWKCEFHVHHLVLCHSQLEQFSGH